VTSVLEFGPFRFDSTRRVLWRSGEPVKIVPKALEVLAALLASRGDVVSKTELLQRAWPDVAVEEANLSVNVSILRRTLGSAPNGRPWIETVARRGYRFAGPVGEAARPRPRSLAVLPFRAIGDATDGLGLAMADTLITRLSSTGRLEVRPTSAIQKYVHAEADIREVGRALQVDAVVEGHLQRSGTRLRVSVQLVPADAGAALWADRFDGELAHLFDVQDAVAEGLAAALSLESWATAPAPRGARQTRSVAAYEAYARGRFFWSRLSRSGLEKAVSCFHESIDLDDGYAAPHAGLADASLAAGFAGALPPKDAWEVAESESDRALALDDRLPEAWISRAWVRLLRDWDWKGADDGFVRAVERDPVSAAAHQWRGLFLALAGRTAEAEEPLRRARSLDPSSVLVFALEGFRLALAGDHEKALAQQQRTAELDPHQFLSRWALGCALQNVGRFEEAVAEHRRALELAEGAAMMRPVLARSLALSGSRDEALRLLTGRDEAAHPSPYQEATVRLALGEEGAALEKLHAACERRDPWAVLLPTDPMLAPLRDHSGLRFLARQVRG
jgi:DNA-binding winged helix-turn-helix (wHTH) protein/tetratricopeptide (TPR) repeat protein